MGLGGYTILDYDIKRQHYLVYSKNIKNNLPITTTAIDRMPCLNPKKTSSQTRFYPMEIERTDVCKEHGTFSYDPRYHLVGDSISEFDIHERYGII